MYLDFTPEQKRLRAELKAYLAALITDEVRAETAGAEGGGPRWREVMRRLGADGWLGLGWPREVGGQGRTAIEELIFFDEIQRLDFPIPFLTLCAVGPTIARHGSDEQKARFLPAILRGELTFAIGYTEPASGTDLASLRTRAVRDGDAYVVNGQKVFTSGADYADYIWLAARTDPEAARHKGISILLVPTDAPGFAVTPIHTLAGTRTNATFYEDVRVPVSLRVGRENEGWKLITTQLNHERVALSAPGAAARGVEDVLAWARASGVLGEPWAQACLAQAHARVEALRLLAWRQAWRIERGELGPADASAVKVWGSESFVQIYRLLLEVLGPAGAVRAGSPGAALRGRIELYYRAALVFTFGGGTNEVQRDIIATAGLGLPAAREVIFMDFSFTEAQTDVAGLARRIFAEHPAEGDAWGLLAESGLLETRGMLEICALLEEQGRAAAPAPLWQTLIGALAAPGATAALLDEGPPATVAAGRISGVKMAVPPAERLVVAAGGSLFVVDARAAGVTVEAQILTTGERAGRVTLERVAGEPLATDAGWLGRRATVALCALELGVVERALAMTAAYTSSRVQFDRPIATFQAVAQRAADAYIDVEVIRLTMWQAAWLLAEGRDDEAGAPVALAKYWAAEAGHRVVAAAQHLHGGIGFDASYPLGRCFLWSKQIELSLGGAARQLAALGAELARGS